MINLLTFRLTCVVGRFPGQVRKLCQRVTGKRVWPCAFPWMCITHVSVTHHAFRRGRVSRTLEAACRDSRAGSPRALVRQPSHRCMVPGVCLYRLSSVHLWCGFLPRNVILCHLCWCIASMQDKNEDSNLSQCQFIFCNMYVILSGLARGISRVDWDSACEMALKTSTVCTSVVAMRNLDRCSGYLCHFRPGGRHSLF